MIQFKYKYLKINGDVNINRRALAEGKEASISFHSESKCFFFHHGDIPQNFEFGLGSTGSVSRFLILLFKLTSFRAFIFALSPVPKSTHFIIYSKHELN